MSAAITHEKVTKDAKTINICKLLRTLPNKTTPKGFMMNYITSTDPDIAYLQRYWAQSMGIDSTMELIDALRLEVMKSDVGRQAWSDFILEEVLSFAESLAFWGFFFLVIT
jgi:hypothetical protein